MTLTVGITGADGLLGWHLRCRLHAAPGLEAVPILRDDFDDPERLKTLVGSCDVMVHMAGMNRGADVDIETTNPDLARQIVKAIENSGRCEHVLYANSVQAGRPTAYGRSKQEAADILTSWADRSGAVVTDMVLPHVFGEGGRPFYNSVVSTFCHQLALGELPTVHEDAALELLHAQRVAIAVLDIIEKPKAGRVRLVGTARTVHGLLKDLQAQAADYAGGRVPEVRDQFLLDLFNTYRSYLFPAHYPAELELRRDQRGELFEAVKSLNGGQTFLSSTLPGFTRGNHYHFRKIERFVVVQGEGLIRLRRLFTDTVVEYRVTGSSPQFVDMPTMHPHNITNVGDRRLVTMFWANEIFDPEAPDTVSEPV